MEIIYNLIFITFPAGFSNYSYGNTIESIDKKNLPYAKMYTENIASTESGSVISLTKGLGIIFGKKTESKEM